MTIHVRIGAVSSSSFGSPVSWFINGLISSPSTYSSQFIKLDWNTSTFSASSQTLSLDGLPTNNTSSFAQNKGFNFLDSNSSTFSFATETFTSRSVTGYANGASIGSGYHDSSNYHWISGGGSYPGTTSRAYISQSTLTLSSQGSTYQHYGGTGFANSGGNGYDSCGYSTSNISTTWKFALSTGSSSAVGNAVSPRYVPAGTFNFGAFGYVGGGQNGTSSVFYYAIEKRAFSTDTASSSGASMTVPCQFAAFVQSNNRGFYIAAGTQTYQPNSTRIDYFAFATDTVSASVSSLTNAVGSVRFFTNQREY